MLLKRPLTQAVVASGQPENEGGEAHLAQKSLLGYIRGEENVAEVFPDTFDNLFRTL